MSHPARSRLMRSDPAIIPDDAHVRWDDMRAHIEGYLNQVDPKRWVITDEQLLEAMTRATLEDAGGIHAMKGRLPVGVGVCCLGRLEAAREDAHLPPIRVAPAQ